MEWSNEAACLSAEPETFFPIGNGGGALDDVAMAKAICGTCAVLDRCRDYALATRQPFGVWGGLDEDERRLRLAGRSAAVSPAEGRGFTGMATFRPRRASQI